MTEVESEFEVETKINSGALLTILCSVARQYPHKLVYNCVEKCSPSSLVDSEQNKVCLCP